MQLFALAFDKKLLENEQGPLRAIPLLKAEASRFSCPLRVRAAAFLKDVMIVLIHEWGGRELAAQQ